jgi:hypothetical protein
MQRTPAVGEEVSVPQYGVGRVVELGPLMIAGEPEWIAVVPYVLQRPVKFPTLHVTQPVVS